MNSSQVFAIVFLVINIVLWAINLAIALFRSKERLASFCALSGWTVALIYALQLFSK
jgi:hypothetical protein